MLILFISILFLFFVSLGYKILDFQVHEHRQQLCILYEYTHVMEQFLSLFFPSLTNYETTCPFGIVI